MIMPLALLSCWLLVLPGGLACSELPDWVDPVPACTAVSGSWNSDSTKDITVQIPATTSFYSPVTVDLPDLPKGSLLWFRIADEIWSIYSPCGFQSIAAGLTTSNPWCSSHSGSCPAVGSLPRVQCQTQPNICIPVPGTNQKVSVPKGMVGGSLSSSPVFTDGAKIPFLKVGSSASYCHYLPDGTKSIKLFLYNVDDYYPDNYGQQTVTISFYTPDGPIRLDGDEMSHVPTTGVASNKDMILGSVISVMTIVVVVLVVGLAVLYYKYNQAKNNSQSGFQLL